MKSLVQILWVSWAAAGGAVLQAQPSLLPLRAGFAETDITPDLGMEIPGGYGKAFHRQFHDPCRVRAVVFDDGRTRVALVSVDALMVPRALVQSARALLQQRCGLEPRAILIGATHSHSSGPVGMVQPGEFDGASLLARKLAYESSSAAHAGYLERVQRELVAAVEEANARRVEVRCGVGTGLEDKAAYNRRFRMLNGQTWTHPGKGNPDILGPAGPIDPQVGVI